MNFGETFHWNPRRCINCIPICCELSGPKESVYSSAESHASSLLWQRRLTRIGNVAECVRVRGAGDGGWEMVLMAYLHHLRPLLCNQSAEAASLLTEKWKPHLT